MALNQTLTCQDDSAPLTRGVWLTGQLMQCDVTQPTAYVSSRLQCFAGGHPMSDIGTSASPCTAFQQSIGPGRSEHSCKAFKTQGQLSPIGG